LLVPSFSSPAPRALPPGAFTARATRPFNSYPHDPPQSGNAPVLLTHIRSSAACAARLARAGAQLLTQRFLEISLEAADKTTKSRTGAGDGRGGPARTCARGSWVGPAERTEPHPSTP